LADARENDYPELMDTPTFNIDDGLSIQEQPISFDVNTNPHFIRLLEKSIQWEASSTRYYESILEMYQNLNRMLSEELSMEIEN
jgi:hypothetical protein